MSKREKKLQIKKKKTDTKIERVTFCHIALGRSASVFCIGQVETYYINTHFYRKDFENYSFRSGSQNK